MESYLCAVVQIKKIDQLLVSSFVGPFIVTFFIALFVLVMQTLWLYIDEIAGKGVGFFLLVELLGYMSVSMIPLALPIAVLISSVVVLGNLAEHYELSSMKSAGISLWRVMIPLMAVTILVSVFSFFCSNNFIPVSNLKFRSRLYDIRRQKPALNLEQGIFNDDFQGYSIRIGLKDPDNRTIHEVLIIDHSESNDGRIMEISAENGEMYVTADERYFVMRLYNGWQYREPAVSRDSKEKYPFIRTSFQEWHKVFDLQEFELERTDENLFKSHQSMLTAGQLLSAIDSIDTSTAERLENLAESNRKYFQIFKRGEKEEEDTEDAKDTEVAEVGGDTISVDTLEVWPDSLKEDTLGQLASEVKKQLQKYKPPRKSGSRVNPISQKNLGRLDTLHSFAQTIPDTRLAEMYGKAKTFARTIHSQTETALRSIDRKRESRVNHVFELHNKFSMAVACFIFLFIGAPMGAIVRKGGFGYPLLIAIVFFMFYMIMTIFSKNIAERFVIDAVLAAWLPCLVLFPIGLVLTYMAMRDYKQVVSFDPFLALLPRRLRKLKVE